MNKYSVSLFSIPTLVVLSLLAVGPAAAQSSSLYGIREERPPMTLADHSWTYQAPEEPKTHELNDLITVVVSEKTKMTSNGKIDRKKTGYGDLNLPAWIKFYGTSLGEDNMNNGVPHVRGEVDNKLQAQGDLQTQDMLSFNITCRVVDKRPNGNLVLEGTHMIRNNEETWQYTLTGEIRPDSVQPNNSVKSQDIADLKIFKREDGHVRDSYRRGWALEWLDKWQPF